MLSYFRGGGAASILGGAIVFAIILVFALEFRPGRQGAGAALATDCTVRVHDRCVDEKEYLAAYRLMAPPGAEAKALRKIGLRAQVLEGLVERELLLREAERLDIAISEDEIDEELTRGRAHVSLPVAHGRDLAWQLGLCPQPSNPLIRECEPGGDVGVRLLPVTSTKTGKFDYTKYERVVRTTTNRGAKEFKEMMRRELIAERMRRLVQSRARVSEAEAFMVYERQFSKAVVRVVRLERDWFARYVADVSDAAVDAWAGKNEEQVTHAWETDKASVQAGCPLVSEILIEVPAGADDEKTAEYRARIDELKARVDGGEQFAQVAREASEGKAGLIGGHLGCLGEAYGEGYADLVAAAKDVKPGTLAPVVHTTRGFHLLLVHGTLAEVDVEAQGRRHSARTLAVRFQAHELAKQFAEELIRRVQGGATLDDATDQLTRDYAERTWKLPAKPAPKKPAKPADGAKAGEEAADQVAAHPALAASDRPQVNDSPPFSIASTPIPGAAPGEAPALKAFQLEPGALHPVPVATDDGWAVMQLKEKTVASREDFDKEKPTLMASLQAAKGLDALVRYVARLRTAAEAHIEIAAEPERQGDQQDDEG